MLKTHLSRIVICMTLAYAMQTMANATTDVPHLFVPDGQLLSRPIQVYVSSTNLSQSVDISLRLVGFDVPDKHEPADFNVWKPYFWAGGQTWSENVSGQTLSYQGTFLLFDLSRFHMALFKSTSRLTPILSWNEKGHTNDLEATTVVGNPVYLGIRLIAAFWTALSVGTLTFLIWGLCRSKSDSKSKLKGVWSLVSGPDNYMSLWRSQLVAWTLAVGSMVFFFGVIQLQVPRIPDSLVALMGMSVVTGGLSSIASRSKQKPKKVAAGEDNGPETNHFPEFSDLISSYNRDINKVVLSVPKAQMLFWTGVILILFVTKSILTGELWDVPWELVALTGVSQAGYVSDKALQTKSAA